MLSILSILDFYGILFAMATLGTYQDTALFIVT